MTKDLQETGVALFNKLIKKKEELDPRPMAPPAENERRPDAIVIQKVARCLAAGLTRQLAASYAGVAPTRIEQWMRKGEDGHPDYVEAWQLIAKSEAEAALSMLDVVAGAATGGAGYDGTAQDWNITGAGARAEGFGGHRVAYRRLRVFDSSSGRCDPGSGGN